MGRGIDSKCTQEVFCGVTEMFSNCTTVIVAQLYKFSKNYTLKMNEYGKQAVLQ